MTNAASKPSIKPEMSTLFMDFARYFELSIARSEAEKAAVYRVRYSVYCEEFGYEDPQVFKDGLESDVFDDRSVHCLVTHRPSGMPAGCVRLVKAAPGVPLPMEGHCGDALDRTFFDSLAPHRDAMAEISRLAVDGQFRRRRGENQTRFGNTDTMHFAAREKRTFSLLALSLFLAATAVADLLRRQHCVAIMEPFLPTILRRMGITVKRVGEDFEYRGVRAPYYLNIDDTIRSGADELRLCYEVVRSQFADVLLEPGSRSASPTVAPVASQVGDALTLLTRGGRCLAS